MTPNQMLAFALISTSPTKFALAGQRKPMQRPWA
jgi:hypothetical protein